MVLINLGLAMLAYMAGGAMSREAIRPAAEQQFAPAHKAGVAEFNEKFKTEMEQQVAPLGMEIINVVQGGSSKGVVQGFGVRRY